MGCGLNKGSDFTVSCINTHAQTLKGETKVAAKREIEREKIYRREGVAYKRFPIHCVDKTHCEYKICDLQSKIPVVFFYCIVW